MFVTNRKKTCAVSKVNKGLQRWTALSKHGQHWLRMFVPSSVSGPIMGKHGRSIKNLEKETGVGIRLYPVDEEMLEQHVRCIDIVAINIDNLCQAAFRIVNECIVPNIKGDGGGIHIYLPNWTSLNLALCASRLNPSKEVVPYFSGFLVTIEGVGLCGQNISDVACAIQADLTGVLQVRSLSHGLSLRCKDSPQAERLHFKEENPVEAFSQTQGHMSLVMVFELQSSWLMDAKMRYMAQLIASCIPEVNIKYLTLPPSRGGSSYHWIFVLSSDTLGAMHFVHRIFQQYADDR